MFVRAVVFGVLCLLAFAGQGHVSTAALPIVEVDSVDGATGFTLHNNGIATTNAIHLASYHCMSPPPCRADGGQGLWISQPGTCKYTGSGPRHARRWGQLLC